MPTFIFNKLVRDKLPEFYEKLEQVIVYKKLVGIDLLSALREKLVEEASEIPVETANREDLISEIADVQQVLDDMKTELGIDHKEVATAQQKKFDKKGGFRDGTFVETIELQDDDIEWTKYYRREPQKYPEVDESGHANPDIPDVEKGTYRHTKSGKLYEVIGMALETETNDALVIYCPLYEHKHELFARPYDMFLQTVDVDGEVKPRFERIKDE